MSRKKADTRTREERREDALRPCRTLGYDRDSLAVYFIEREAFALAEGQLKRAIWLNPYEPDFTNHLAWCLYMQDRFSEALEWARKSLEQKDDPNTHDLLALIERALNAKDEKHA